MDTLTFKCLVHGQDAQKIFPVKISAAEDVINLKAAIKDTNLVEFRNVDADTLDLYSTFLPNNDDEKLQDKLEKLTLGGRLRPWSRLSELFPVSKEGEWFIIVVPSFAEPLAIVPDIALNYWARGDPMHMVTHVKISSAKTVADLKEAIKNRRPVDFRDVDIDALVLYKAALAYDDVLEDVLGTCSISSLGSPLWPLQKLSTVFIAPPPRNQLHLVVDGPQLALSCWVRGVDFKNSFETRISTHVSVNDLKSAIKTAHTDLGHVSSDCLKLYKISADDKLGIRKSLTALGAGQLLKEDELLEKVVDDVPFSQRPRVIVEPLDGHSDPITRARDAYLASHPQVNPAALPLEFWASLRLGDFYRPRGNEESILSTLLLPVFGQLVDDCQTIEVTTEDNDFVARLAAAVSASYDDEFQWVRGIAKVFQSYCIPFTVPQIKNSRGLVDGDISVNGHRYMIAEFERRAEKTPAKSRFQVLSESDYVEWTRETATRFPRSPLPCLYLSLYGQYIMFSSATWNLRPMMQDLTEPVAFNFHSTDAHIQHNLARHMAAFRKATQALKQYYESLQETALPIPPYIFPHPTSYMSLRDKTPKHFQYVKQLLDKLIFFGAEDEGDRDYICIKFTQTYSRDAHEYFASLGCAPGLRGFERIPGGWFMVIMDILPLDFDTLSARTEPVSSSLFSDISAKLHSFHEAGYVHGDIRDSNILVSESDEKRFMIIDFDWAGSIGEARYPVGVNYMDIERPEEARDGKEILPAHDIAMLDHIARFKSE